MEIEITELTFKYPGKKEPVFSDFSFSAKPGITLLKGFSGCGKSTLLRLIAGYLKPKKGKVQTTSKHKVGSSRFLIEEVGFVFQQMNLLPLASLQRNIELSGLKQSHQEINLWLERLGLSELGNKSPNKLSGGQMQRGAIARALAKIPQILLLDEPTSGLDDLNTKVIIEVLKEHLPKEAVCLIATHDSRLNLIADEILDFNHYLPLEEHLESLV